MLITSQLTGEILIYSRKGVSRSLKLVVSRKLHILRFKKCLRGLLSFNLLCFIQGEHLTVVEKQSDHWWIAKNSRGFVFF